MQPWKDAWVWESVAEEIGDHRRRGYGALITEDVLRFVAARAMGEAVSGSPTLWLEPPHPTLPGSHLDLVVGEPPEAVVEFSYPGEPNKTNAAQTTVLAEILKDFYRLAAHPGNCDRICVLALTRSLRGALASSGIRYGVDLDNVQISINAQAAAAFPRSSSGVMGDELRDHPVRASRLSAVDVDEDLRIIVFLVDPVAGPSNSIVALAVMTRSDATLFPGSGPEMPRKTESALAASSKTQNETGGGEHLTIWYQLAKCVNQLDEPFRRSEIIGRFRRHYPDTKESSLTAHIQSATANGGYATGQFTSRQPLLVRVEHGVYRRYRSDAD